MQVRKVPPSARSAASWASAKSQSHVGRWRLDRSYHGTLIAQMLAHGDFLDTAISDLANRLDQVVTPFQEVIDRVITIPGVPRRTSVMLRVECGADMTVFPTAAHQASWAGICPGNNDSGGKSRPGHTRHCQIALRTALTEATHVAWTKGTYVAAHHAQI